LIAITSRNGPARVGPARDHEPAAAAAGVARQLGRTEIFRGFQKSFEDITGLPLQLQAPGSLQFPLADSKRLNPFCALLARRNHACSACLQLQQRLEEDALRGPSTLTCVAGLSESAVPVRAGTKLLGYLRTGQVFLRAPTPRRFAAFLREIGPAPPAPALEQLRAAYFQTPVIAPRRYESMLRLLAIFSEHIGAVSNQALVQAATVERPTMTKARAFIVAHQGEDLRLQQVAVAVHLSPFYFCKLFKRATGFTFTHYLARLRIEAVKGMLLQTHTRVTEAAYASGFQSLSQFNRVFRRIAGESASEFRRGLAVPPPRRAFPPSAIPTPPLNPRKTPS
jgi:AraC-like DNA-binding protein